MRRLDEHGERDLIQTTGDGSSHDRNGLIGLGVVVPAVTRSDL